MSYKRKLFDVSNYSSNKITKGYKTQPLKKPYMKNIRQYAKMPKEEKKYLDTALQGNIDSTGELASFAATVTGLCLIPQGDTSVTRDGRECTVTSIQIRGIVKGNTTLNPGIARLILIQDTQSNKAYPAYSDIFTGTDYKDFRNLDNNKRFKVLRDLSYDLQSFPTTTPTYSNPSIYIDEYLKVSIPITFSGATGAIGEITQNNIFLAWVSSADDTITCDLKCRIRFLG